MVWGLKYAIGNDSIRSTFACIKLWAVLDQGVFQFRLSLCWAEISESLSCSVIFFVFSSWLLLNTEMIELTVTNLPASLVMIY